MGFASVTDYLAAQPPAARKALKQVRAALKKALPKTEEVISYQIPAYRVPGGRIVLYFAGWKAHFSIYPATAGVAKAFGAVLGDRLGKKGTIAFPLDEKVPVGLIAKIAKLRWKEATAGGAKPLSAAGAR